mmetsp:Transcript_127573/g.254890  ORF Transcript_127573/g.254890 Transcript_127573/m.254890 type:complete len:586 (-) Transcript_127573:188-1945(-)
MPKKAAGVKMSLSEATVKFGIDPRAGQLPTHSEGKDFGKGKGKGGLRDFDDSRGGGENDWRSGGGKDGGKGRRDRDEVSRSDTGDWFAKDGAGGGGRSGGGDRGGGGFRGGERRQDDTEADKDRDWRRGGDDRGGDNRRGGGRGDDDRWGRGNDSRPNDGPPMERKRLELKPRSKPVDNDDRVPARASRADDEGEKRNLFGNARARDEVDSRPTTAPPWKNNRSKEAREPESKEDQGGDDWNTVPSSKKTASTSKTTSKTEEVKSSKSVAKKRQESSEDEDESDEDSEEALPKKSNEKKAYVPPGRAKEQSSRKLEQDREGKARMGEEKKDKKEKDSKLSEKDKKKQMKEQEKQESREKKEKKSSKADRGKDEEVALEDPKQTKNNMLIAFEERCESLLNSDADVEDLVDEAPSLLPEGSIQTVGPIGLLFGRMLRHCHGKKDEEVVALVQRLAPLLNCLIKQAQAHRFKVLVLCELQRLAHGLGLPRLSPATSLIEAVFDGLYCAEVIEEDYFQIWSINDDDTPGKTDAMFQLSAFLDWLRDAKIEGETSSEEEEDDDEDRDDDDEDEDDSDIEKNIPQRPIRR